MHKILVLMTVYKNDSFKDFHEALESIHQQTYKEYDIYVQEDGQVSTEIDHYLKEALEQKRIQYLGKRLQNKGFDYSLNELISLGLSNGYKYFIRMDADDISLPHRIEKQIHYLEEYQNIDIIGTYIEEFGDGVDYKKIVKYPLSHDDMFNFFQKRVPLAHVSVAFRDTFFKKAGLYPVSGHMNNGDTLMWLQGFDNECVFANMDFIGVKVRVTKGFFGRRSGYDKAISDFKNRLSVIKKLNYPLQAYVYAMGVFLVNISPPKFKKLAYKYLR